MIRTAKFLVSRPMYAVDLSSWQITSESTGVGGLSAHATVSAVWFRRRAGVTAACAGLLWDIQRPVPATVAQFLDQHDDGRYGGQCKARWDGRGLWSDSEEPEARDAHLALLRPMLENYPEIPDGFDGWWRF